MKVTLGGQAVTNGVLISSSKYMAVAVRKNNGKIRVKEKPCKILFKNSRIFNWPFLRGIKVLLESAFTEKFTTKERPQNLVAHIISLSIGVILLLGPVILIPRLIVYVIGIILGQTLGIENVLFHVISDTATIGMIVLYVYLVSLIPSIKELFTYHGAEHIAANAYENGEELTVENARKYSIKHPRCGTVFLAHFLILSSAVFAILFPVLLKHFGRPTGNYFLDCSIYVLVKILLVVPVICITYELQGFLSRHIKSWWAQVLIFPGMLLQELTVKTPDDKQLEIGLAATLCVIKKEDVGDPASIKTTTYKDYAELVKALDNKKLDMREEFE